MSQHAILSPSAASRWIACPPSARLEQQFPDSESEFAAEGTLAHKLGEAMIRRDAKMISKTEFNRKLKEIKADKLFQPEMIEYCEDYAAFVAEKFAAVKAHTPHAMLKVETKLDMSEYVPEGFGTADVCIGGDGVLEFIDLKYGKGVPVYATQNKQMMLYSLGALLALGFLYDFQSIRMTIYQPRLDNISSWEIYVDELMHWAEKELKPAAEKAFKGEGKFAIGPHCQFCRARAMCKAQADYQLEMARHDFAAPALVQPEDISDVLKRKKDFESWLKEVEDFAMEQALNHGVKWPGMKLVEGRSNRMYIDEKAVIEKLTETGYTEDKIFKPRALLGIGEMEKLVTKKAFGDLLGPFVTKPPGKPTLVPAEDPRPELKSVEAAAADFDDEFVQNLS